MSIGSDLLDLQELDLDRERAKRELAELPALVELAKKRKSHARLKGEAMKLLALRKDAETELADLDAEEQACHEGVAAAQGRPLDASDYHQVQQLEEELTGFAKRLDKVAHARVEAKHSLADARAKEWQLADYISRFEAAIRGDAQEAREQATSLQERIARDERRREHLIGALPPQTAAAYAAASKRFHGLAVERLDGQVPSICRTTLQPASLDSLRRAGEVAECPYCHRMLVCEPKDA